MGTINQIKAKLLELEGGKFQRLCDDWLHRKGYENINAIGMSQINDRVVKGTPDSLLIQSNGQYIFAEYTVQQNRLVQKLQKDISKCFDEKKTGILNKQISEIIICYLDKLSTHEINHLNSLCLNNEVKLSLYGIDTLALSIQNNFPVLSELYLGLSLDTGQLLSIDDFVNRYGKNEFTTSIDNKILFQSEALKQCAYFLEEGRFLLISGSSGVGKTLFSVELLKIIKNQTPQLKVYCIFDKGADLNRDITAYFSEPGDYLIFIDDANRLDNRLDYILHYLNELDNTRTFRIIATVRDYAREPVITKVSQYTQINEHIIQPLSDEQIKKLIIELFDIKNSEYQLRIQEIAKGNARLAIMAAKVAIKTQQIESIQNVTSLYDDYFGQNESVKDIIENKKLMTTACAISFFRKIDKLNDSQMSYVQNVFGIQIDEFWEFVNILNKKELVDLYEDEVVRISDQVLSTYLFYLSVFEKKIIPFSKIVNNFYPELNNKIVDALNPIISAFDHKKIANEIKREIQDIFNEISKCKVSDDAIKFLNSFWFALPTESLIYAKNAIYEMQPMEIDWEKEVFEETKEELKETSIIKLLSYFRYYGVDELKISFGLLLEFLEKSQESLGSIIKELIETYNFKSNDKRYGYFVQTHVIKTLIERMNDGGNYLFTRLFILVAKFYLKVEHREYQWTRDDNVNFITFRLSPDEYLLPLREKIIKNLSNLLVSEKYNSLVLEVFQDFSSHLIYEGKEMAIADLKYIKDYLIENLNQSELSHCQILQDICDHLESFNIEFPLEWRTQFKNPVLELSNLLIDDRHDRRKLEMGYKEYNQYCYQRLVEYFTVFTQPMFIDFMENCVILNRFLSGRERDYSLKEGIITSLQALADIHPEIFSGIISSYLDYDDIFELNPNLIILKLVKKLPVSDVWILINSKKYKNKKLWCSVYFSLMPVEYITKEEVKSLLLHLDTTPSTQLPHSIEFLTKYRVIDKDIFPKVARTLVTKSYSEANYARPLGWIFYKDSEVFGSWFEIFQTDEELLYDVYIAAFKVNSDFDHSGEALDLLMAKNSNFLKRVVDCIYENERSLSLNSNIPELNFLWQRQSFLKDIEDYAKYIYNKEKDLFSIPTRLFRKLFLKGIQKPNENKLTEKKEEFIKYTITKNIDNFQYVCFIFSAANSMREKLKIELLDIFLKNNNNFEDFKTLECGYGLWVRGWSGSKVPILEREKNYLEKILPLLSTADLLEHKAYIEKRIEFKINEIEIEKKRDFLGN
ncbi:hypothetical protein ACX1FB_05860 [Legionella pneumophila]|uniref:hypothetical protein n=1 Tax=Legionella pneumophila TaxID=446 RepID=UPI0007709934|nr:hypothetical protein [Legionella pneumophila]CZJ19880.1 Uncharacterised protein [Legionella pneumophila]HAT7878442.1 DNA replication protein [Legionella pneumophila]HAU1400820.1 DNA replication protein [Legionella pneumophila]HAU2169839.1 DNA replication protein [Legionella pneumophila]HBD7087189.1 hypothetical protein [Legionella pneumophila]